jgi:hypothetical protein
MPIDNQNGWDPKKPARLKGFDRKDTSDAAQKPAASPSPSAPATAGRARLNFPPPKPAAEPAPEPPASAPEAPRAVTPRTESQRTESQRPPASSDRVRPRNTPYTPDPDPDRVARRQWWKYDLYKRSGRQDAGGRDAGQGRSM